MIFCSEVESWEIGDKCHVPIFNFILIWFGCQMSELYWPVTVYYILYFLVAWDYLKIKRWDPHLHVFQKLLGDHSRQRGVTRITTRVRVYQYFFSPSLKLTYFRHCYCPLVILPPPLLLFATTITSTIAAITITITTAITALTTTATTSATAATQI